ncbi:MAG TPA: YihY/virulence factor BrkB family protein [Vicinamibacteria bacterium]|jgi:membrane protein
MGAVVTLLKDAWAGWRQDDAPRLGAALAYYTAFSLAPCILIAVSVAGLVFGTEAAQGQVAREIEALVGTKGAQAVQEMLEGARRPASGAFGLAVGFATLLLGASGAFGELRASLNTVWDVPAPPRAGLLAMVRERLLSFAMVLVVGFLLLVSLVASAALSAIGGRLSALVPGVPLLEAVNAALSLGVIALLFALMFRLLPDAEVAWRDVWVGALATAALFTLGKWLIGLYLGRSALASAHGAAGAMLALLAWVYYAAQVFFFGAEITQAYAVRHGSRMRPPASVGRAVARLVPGRR